MNAATRSVWSPSDSQRPKANCKSPTSRRPTTTSSDARPPAQPFAKGCAGGLASELVVVGRREVGDLQFAFGLWESLGDQTDLVAAFMFQSGDLAHQVARPR